MEKENCSLHEIIERFTKDIIKISSRNMFDDMNYSGKWSEKNINEGDAFVFIVHTFSIAYDRVIYSKKLSSVVEYMNEFIASLDKEYLEHTSFKSIQNDNNTTIAFKGSWKSEDGICYFYEGAIIKAVAV